MYALVLGVARSGPRNNKSVCGPRVRRFVAARPLALKRGGPFREVRGSARLWL
jgi:hypothetical protein